MSFLPMLQGSQGSQVLPCLWEDSKVIDRHWELHKIKIRAKEILEEYPRKKLISFGMMVRDVIAVRREINWLRISRYR